MHGDSYDPGPPPPSRPFLDAFHGYDEANHAYQRALHDGRCPQDQYELLRDVRDLKRAALLRLLFAADQLVDGPALEVELATWTS